MTDVTEAMLNAATKVGIRGGTYGIDPEDARAIYLAMEAARIPAPAPDDYAVALYQKLTRISPEHSTEGYPVVSLSDLREALSAIPIPATGEVERDEATDAALEREREANRLYVARVLRDAREQILDLAHARWSECEATDEHLVGDIDAALSAIPIPAPTGEVERAWKVLCESGNVTPDGNRLYCSKREFDAALTNHTTKDDE